MNTTSVAALLAACLAILLAAPAHADPPQHPADSIQVAFNRDQTNESLYIAAIMGTRQGNDLIWDVFWADWGRAYMNLHRDHTFERAQFELHKAQQAWTAKYQQSDVSRQAQSTQEFVSDLMEWVAYDPTAVLPMWSKAVQMSFRDKVLEPWLAEGELADGIVVARDNGRRADDVLRTLTERLRAQRVEALANPAYRKLIDQEYVHKSNIQADFTTAEILRNSPALKTLTGVRQLINDAGEIKATLGVLRAEVRTGFAQINAGLGDIRGRIVELQKGQLNLLAYAARAEERELAREKAEAEAAQAQLRLDAAKSSVYVLSTLIGFVDAKAGRDVALVGNAAIQVADSLNKFSVSMAGFGDAAGKITALGTAMSSAVLTGNLLAAAMSLAPVFDPNFQTPEDMIMTQIGALRDQVEGVRTEMRDRFDRVDAGLNQVYGSMLEGFARMADGQGRILGGVRRLQDDLNRVQARMNRFEGHVYELVGDLEGRRLWNQVDLAIGYRERSGGQSMTFDGFFGYESVFHMWTTDFAFDSIATGPDVSGRPVNDAEVDAELSKHPLDMNINYLNRFAVENLGVPGFLTGKAPNPRQWGLGARAAAALDLEWPEHAARMPASRARDRAQVGEAVAADLRRIVDAGTLEDPQANRLLFERLFDNYRANAELLEAEVARVEADHLHALDLRLDLWGGPEQPVRNADLPSAPVKACEYAGSRPSLSVPRRQVIEEVLPKPFLVARRLGLGDVGLCYSAGFGELQERWSGNWRELYATLYVSFDSTYARVGADGQLGSRQPVRTGVVEVPDVTVCREYNDPETGEVSGCAPYEHDPYYHANWGLEGDATTVADSGLSVAPEVRAALEARQAGLYDAVVAEFAAGSLHAPAERLDGAKKGIDGLVALGLPRALETDELLAALLFGDPLADMTPRLPDGALARVLYATAEPGGKGVSVRLDEALKRIDLLEATVEGYLDLVDAGTDHESHRFLETALARAHIAAGVAEMQRVLPPPVGPDPRPPIAQPIPDPRPPIVDPIPDPDPPKRGCEALTGKARAACLARRRAVATCRKVPGSGRRAVCVRRQVAMAECRRKHRNPKQRARCLQKARRVKR